MLLIQKLFYAWLLPPGIFLLVIAALYFYYRKTNYANGLVLLFLLIYLLSVNVVSDKIIEPLENHYAQPVVSEVNDAKAIVVLAGGSYDGVPDFDGIGQNSESSTVRLVAGLRLHRMLHLPMVLSGGSIYADKDTEASVEFRFLRSCGVEEQYLIKEDRSRNTAENAKYVKQICQQRNFDKVILVTSAFHMPRSVAFFKREGVDVIPYPTDYKTSRNTRLNAFVFTPNAGNLYRSSLAMKEYLGLLAIKMGWQ